MVKTSVQCWVCMTNQQWNQKSLMSFNVLRTNWKKKKHRHFKFLGSIPHIKHLWWRLYIPFKVFGLNPTSLNIYGGDKCSMLTLHDKPTLTPKSLHCSSMFYVPFKVFGLHPTSLNIYGEDKCPMLSLHDKPTLTPKSLHCSSMFYIPFKVFGLNPTTLNIYGEDKCSMLSLHDKPTMKPKVFNVIQCSTYQLKKKKTPTF